MLGVKEWAFVLVQALIIATIILSTFTVLDRISDYMLIRRERRMQRRALAQFKRDVKEYLERDENGEDH